mmetsp:Transcript_89027/g.172465  ORF Transcript_89027/g.172465 Transcript_89027/m.172465 type:complete len:303 (-) Transcript_89027:78-986(-)
MDTSVTASEEPALCSWTIKGSSTSSGTTAMSCMSNTPRDALPTRSVNCPCSCRSFSTKAEELRAKDAPTTSDSSKRRMSTMPKSEPTKSTSKSTPPRKGNSVNTTVHRTICRRPMPNAYFASALSLFKLNSSPCSKSRKRIPTSPTLLSTERSANMPNPAGPSSTPAARKPSTGEMFTALHRGTTAEVAPRKMSRSRPTASNAASVGLPAAAEEDASAMESPPGSHEDNWAPASAAWAATAFDEAAAASKPLRRKEGPSEAAQDECASMISGRSDKTVARRPVAGFPGRKGDLRAVLVSRLL